MPINTQFVTAPVGEWTQICEMRSTRNALLVQALGCVSVLNIQTTGPDQFTALGTIPGGMYHSMDQGAGPGVFRLSADRERELSQQQWSIFVVSVDQPPAGAISLVAAIRAINGPGPTTGSTTFFATPQLLVAVLWDFTVGAHPSTLTSTSLGALTAAEAVTGLTTPSAHKADLQVYVWEHPGGTDTLTATTSAAGDISVGVYSLAPGLALDIKGKNSGAAPPMSVSATGVTAHVIETGLVAVLALGNDVFTPPPWTTYEQDSGTNTFGDFWGSCISTEPINGTGHTVSVVPSSGGGITAWGAIALSIQLPDPTVAAVVTVIEEFDDPVHTDYETFSVGLPQLGPWGRAKLQELIGATASPLSPPAGDSGDAGSDSNGQD